MYQWLSDALQGPSTVITANRRLARVLRQEFARQQVQLDRSAWESPAIFSWQDWLAQTVQGATDQAELPARLNSHQSQLLWERCLQKEVGESAAGISSLVRLSRDAWQRMADWQVSIQEVARSAQSHDHRLFAAAAGRYLGILERESWVDDAGLGQLINRLLREGRTPRAGQVTFVGFDRARPLVSAIQEALTATGAEVRHAPERPTAARLELQCFESAEAEMRAAGAWARARLEDAPDESIAIIATSLEKQAQQAGHLVREGLVPGWQYAPASLAQAVNTSYGRKLGDYPAVSVALLLLNWLVRDVSSIELGHLLRTPMLGSASLGGRSRFELRLRQLPARRWTPAMVSSTFRGAGGGSAANEWLEMVAHLTTARRELQKRKRASPADWAIYIDEMLVACGWPGSDALSSFDFQLVNRWRDTLNDLARLDVISPSMDLKTAIRRLGVMATDAVFQPESDSSRVQLMGPLEASGAEFGAIWISGVTAANWPPAGNPSPLLARQLQRRFGMPDAEPSDTVDYAQNLLLHLGRAAPQVVCSYAKHEDDAEQSPSGLLAPLGPQSVTAQPDPGWHASLLATTGATVLAQETVPAMQEGERISGGAGVIQRQLNDPVSAFIAGRLGVAYLQAQAIGLPAPLRGNIIHDALHRLYIDTPSQRDIAAWSEEQLQSLISQAVDSAFGRHERNTDESLAQLLRLERTRIANLLREFVGVDGAREEFTIEAVEHQVSFAEADIQLQLRIDRIDRLNDGTLAILDYKTGAKRTLIDNTGQPKEIQLIAYALALDAAVSAVALVNVDSRAISFEGAGAGYAKSDDWETSLAAWKDLVRMACRAMSAGDVRINAAQGVQDARAFNLLTRYTELLRGD
jgi:probable DNA repair protein